MKCFFFFKQKTAYEISLGLVGSEMCIRDRPRLPGYLHITGLALPLLSFLLLLQKLLLSGNIAAVALCQYVLTHGLYSLSGDNLTARCPP